jgi:hypothetical protein
MSAFEKAQALRPNLNVRFATLVANKWGHSPTTLCLARPMRYFVTISVQGVASLRGLILIQTNTPFDQAIGWRATLWLNGDAKQAVTEGLVVQS